VIESAAHVRSSRKVCILRVVFDYPPFTFETHIFEGLQNCSLDGRQPSLRIVVFESANLSSTLPIRFGPARRERHTAVGLPLPILMDTLSSHQIPWSASRNPRLRPQV